MAKAKKVTQPPRPKRAKRRKHRFRPIQMKEVQRLATEQLLLIIANKDFSGKPLLLSAQMAAEVELEKPDSPDEYVPAEYAFANAIQNGNGDIRTLCALTMLSVNAVIATLVRLAGGSKLPTAAEISANRGPLKFNLLQEVRYE